MAQFDSAIGFSPPGAVSGFVIDRSDLQRRLVVGLFRNGGLVQGACADQFDPAIETGDGCYGFSFSVDVSALADIWDVRVLNTSHFIGRVIPDQSVSSSGYQGVVTWASGLTLRGHFEDGVTAASSFEVLAYHGSAIVGRSRIDRWQHVGAATDLTARRLAFDLILDASLADGEPRSIDVRTSTGATLQGSPVQILAYGNQFRDACLRELPSPHSRLARRILGALLDNSAPLSSYAEFYPELNSFAEPAALFGESGAYRQDGDSGHVLVHHRNMAIRADYPSLLNAVSSPLCYFDFAIAQVNAVWPVLLPAFDLERLGEQGYCGFAFAIDRELFAACLERQPSTPLALLLDAIQHLELPDSVHHLPLPIGVLDNLDEATEADLLLKALQGAQSLWGTNARWEALKPGLFPRARLHRDHHIKAVSVIIPTKDNAAYLRDCVSSLFAFNAGLEIELIVVDNNSTQADALLLLDQLEAKGAKILEYRNGFNYAQMNNLAVEHASHEALVLLNSDVAFFQHDTLAELLGRLSDPSVGAVGPVMIRASDIVQHGGVVLGTHNGAVHAFEDRMLGDAGYTDLLKVAHETAAVTGALLVTTKTLFEELDGFDERAFPINFNDVDYCLRLRQAGYRVVLTPHAIIRHYESVSRGSDMHSPGRPRLEREIEVLRERWFDVIRNDPFYHPLLSIESQPYRALSLVHRSTASRTNKVIISAVAPAGF